MMAEPPKEEAIEAPGPAGPLRGTFTRLQGQNAPVVLIVPGSGPTDRDGNNPLGVKGSTYKLLAEALAGHGIASIRIDKRGMFGSAGAVPDANDVTIQDYAEDVRTWVRSIRELTGAPCVWVLGHSEGGVVALVAAEKNDPGICGLILVATPGRPLGAVLREQLMSNPANAPLLGQAMAAIAALEEGRPVDVANMDPALAPLFHPRVQGYIKTVIGLDPAELIAKQTKPMLILQGERDIQVGVADAHNLKESAPSAQLVLLPDVNHVLKAVTTPDRRANLATYTDAALPLAPGIVESIVTFVTSASP